MHLKCSGYAVSYLVFLECVVRGVGSIELSARMSMNPGETIFPRRYLNQGGSCRVGGVRLNRFRHRWSAICSQKICRLGAATVRSEAGLNQQFVHRLEHLKAM